MSQTTLHINTEAKNQRNGLVKSSTDFSPLGSLYFVAGDSPDILLKFYDGVGSSYTLGTQDVRLSIGKLSAKPASGTWTISDGTDTTSALDYNITPANLQTALNGLNSGAGYGNGACTVTGSAGGPYILTWNSNGSRPGPTIDTTALSPSASVVASEVIAGDGSTKEVQYIKLYQSPVAYIDTSSFTISTNEASGVLNLDTKEMIEMLGDSESLDLFLEVELVDTDNNRFTPVQAPVTIRNEGLIQGFSGVVSLPDYLLSTNILDEDDMASNSAQYPPSQQSTKAYVDAIILDEDDLASNSPTKGPSQQSIKVYVDGKILDEDDFLSNSSTAAPSQQSAKVYIDGKVLDEDDFLSDSPTKAPSQQSTKVYVDSKVLDEDDLVSDSTTKAPSQQSIKQYINNQGFIQSIGNSGAGESLAKAESANNVDMKSITAGSNISVTGNTDDVQVAFDGSSEVSISSGAIDLSGNKISGDTASVADDAVGTFTAPRPGGFVLITATFGASQDIPDNFRSLWAYYDVATTPTLIKLSGVIATGVTVTTGALTGTTGTDDEVTVSAHEGDILVENRRAQPYTFTVTFL